MRLLRELSEGRALLAKGELNLHSKLVAYEHEIELFAKHMFKKGLVSLMMQLDRYDRFIDDAFDYYERVSDCSDLKCLISVADQRGICSYPAA